MPRKPGCMPSREPLDVADDHARGLRQPALEVQFLHAGLAIAGRPLRAHRLRRPQAGGAPERANWSPCISQECEKMEALITRGGRQ